MQIVATVISIPEDTVKEAADLCADDKDNSFFRVWTTGQEYKSAGLTPVYLLNREKMQLYVIAAEIYGKKLH